jgi:hypothetical protein
MVRLPNFLVVGAPKSGTTSLYYYLRQHPDVYLPVQKELHYFSYKHLQGNARGPGDKQVLEALCANHEEYSRHYVDAKDEHVIGDISPSYLYYGVQESIKHELGDVKIVVMLRNPVKKAHSQYMHMVLGQREPLSFQEALMATEKRQKDGWSDIWRYAESSLYTDRLLAYMNCFGKNNVHVIVFDEFITQPKEILKRLFLFLGIEESVRINTDKTYNRTGEARSTTVSNLLNRPNFIKTIIKSITPDAWRISLRLKIMDANTAEKTALDDKDATYLRGYFADDIARLEMLLKRELNWL